jgi:hypothetical protein
MKGHMVTCPCPNGFHTPSNLDTTGLRGKMWVHENQAYLGVDAYLLMESATVFERSMAQDRDCPVGIIREMSISWQHSLLIPESSTLQIRQTFQCTKKNSINSCIYQLNHGPSRISLVSSSGT